MCESNRWFVGATAPEGSGLYSQWIVAKVLPFCASVLMLLTVACSGGQSDDNEQETTAEAEVTAESTVMGDTPTDRGQCLLSGGPGVIRRLTKSEYQNSLAALFQREDFPFEEPLSGNIVEDGYSTLASGLWVRDLTAQAISIHGEGIASWAVESVPEQISICRTLTLPCAGEMLDTFASRAFRMPVEGPLRERYLAALLAATDWPDAAHLLVSATIQSPYFLYRRELGFAEGERALLNSHEKAASLSYSLASKSPDASLQAAANAGALSDELQLQAEVTRLLESDDAVEALSDFVIEWLALAPVLSKTKTEGAIDLPIELRESMLGEVRALVAAVYREQGGLAQLLARDTIFVNRILAAHYGIEDVLGDEFIELPAGNRVGGLLGTAAYLLSHSTVDSSSPTARGYFIRKRLLCRNVPPPPPSVDTDLPMLTDTLTTRQRFSQHLADPVCESCHAKIDNYGYAFESFDGLGRFREMENGIPVDTVGMAVDLDGGSPAFEDGRGLTALLVTSPQVQHCFHEHLLEYISGQEAWDGTCSIDQVARSSQDASLRSTLRGIVSLPHYQFRIPQGQL